MAETFDETAFIRAIDENRYAEALEMVLSKADASIAPTSPPAPGSSAVQVQAEADAATMAAASVENVRALLSLGESETPLDENEIAALIIAGRALGIAEAFAASVELRWPEIIERHTIVMKKVLKESARGRETAH